MSEELEVLKTVVKRLDAANIPYMITGSIAANFYTIPRMTRDIDIVVELEQRNIDKIYNLFSEDFYIEKEMVRRAAVERGMFNIIHNVFVIKVDFIVRKDTSYRQEEFRRRRRVSVESIGMAMVTPEDLIISKLFWARESHSEMHLTDVRNLLASVEDIDQEYIKKWTRRLGLEVLYKEVLE